MKPSSDLYGAEGTSSWSVSDNGVSFIVEMSTIHSETIIQELPAPLVRERTLLHV